MVLDDYNNERAEAYRVLADFFLKAPTLDILETIKEDFELQSKESAEEISIDFNYLFVCPGGRLPPVESLFSRPAGAASANEALKFYADSGLVIDEEFSLMPDHFSVEMLFMSYLIEINRSDLQKKFLEQHILNWVPYYCEEVKKQAKTVFYREIAEIVEDFLASEHEEIFE